MHLQGKPVCSFDPEGLIFAAGVNSEMVKLYDLRSFDKVKSFESLSYLGIMEVLKGKMRAFSLVEEVCGRH